MIEFLLDDTQELLQQTTREFAREVLRPHARKAEEKRELEGEVWERYRELGLILDEYPEELGGGALELTSVLVAAEELGYGDLGIAAALPRPGPAGWILLRLGKEDQRVYLSRAAQNLKRGLLLYTPWMLEEEWDPAQLPLRYRKEGEGFLLYGEYPLAFGVDHLGFVVALAREEDGGEIRGFLLEPEEVEVLPDKLLCGCEVVHIAPVRLERKLPRERVLEGDLRSALREALTRERLRHAAFVLGAARAAFEEAVEYAQIREAFGRKIAEFQAVAFMIANAAIDLEGSRNLLYQAAWSLEKKRKDGEQLAHEAVIHTYLVADRITTDAVQIFGGNGFVQDYPVEKFMRDVRTLSLIYGSRPYLDSLMIPESPSRWVRP